MLSSLSLTHRAVRRAWLAAVSCSLALILAMGLGSPAMASGAVEVTQVTVTSESVYEWSLVGITAQWSVTGPAKGDVLKVSLGEGLQWHQAVGFQLTALNDLDVKVGDCKVDYKKNTLTCTLNSNVEAWDTVTGTLTASAQITSAMLGKDSVTVTANGTTGTLVPGDTQGDGSCDASTGCGPVRPEPVSWGQYQNGWLRGYKDGTYTWTWSINTTGATEYTVVDPGADKLDYVVCTSGSTWQDTYNPQDAHWDTSTHTLTWTAGSATDVCRALLVSTTTAETATSTVSVNGQALSATASAQSLGSGSVDGPKRTPSSPTGSVSPTPAADPAGTSGTATTSAGAQGVASTARAAGGADPASTASGTAPASPADGGGLASTGVTVVVGAVACAALLAGMGALYLARSRRS